MKSNYAPFIPKPNPTKLLPGHFNANGKKIIPNIKAENPMAISLKLLRMKLKQKSGRDGERFTLLWTYEKNEFTLTNFFKEGEPVKLTDEISSTAGEMSQVLLADIKKNLKKHNCKTILNMLLECNYTSLDITRHEVYFLNEKNEKKVWKG